MGDSYENTQMPEKPEESVNPDAIPVDDKGRPLPDPTENFRDYIAPSGLEALKQAYEAVEEDEGVKETMEPPQQTTFFKKHRSGKRGYDYYGTPAGSVPNDSNGIKPSALSELFSAAEAVEVEAVENDEDEQFKAFDPIANIQKTSVIATPDQKEMQTKSVLESNDPRDAFIRAGYSTADDKVFKKNEVKRDTSTPRILDYYKDSTNTKVIFESGTSENNSALSSSEKTASDLFNNTVPLTKAQIRAAKKAEKKAMKEKARLLKKQAKAKRKAEKAQRKAELKAKKSGATFGTMPAFNIKGNEPAQAPVVKTNSNEEIKTDANAELAQRQAKEIAEKARIEKEAAERKAKESAEKAKLEKEAAEKAKLEKEAAEQEAKAAAEKLKLEKEAAEKAKLEKEAAEQEAKAAAEKLKLEKEAAEKAKLEKEAAEQEAKAAAEKLKLEKEAAEKARLEKEAAERFAKETAQEAENKLRREQEALQRHKEEIKLAQQKHSETTQLLEEEKAAAQKAREEAERARQEAQKVKEELELMKNAAAKALEEKQKAEEAAKKAKEEKERFEAEAHQQKHAKSALEEKFRQERDEAIAKAKAEKDAAVAKAKAEREAAVAKAKADRDAAIAKAKATHAPKSKLKDIYSDSSKMSDENGQPIIYESKDIYIGSAPKRTTDIEELKKDLSLLIDKSNIVSRSSKKEITQDDKSKK